MKNTEISDALYRQALEIVKGLSIDEKKRLIEVCRKCIAEGEWLDNARAMLTAIIMEEKDRSTIH